MTNEINLDALRKMAESPYPTIYRAWSEGEEHTQQNFASVKDMLNHKQAGIYYAFIKGTPAHEEFWNLFESCGWTNKGTTKYDAIAKSLVGHLTRLGCEMIVFTDAHHFRKELQFLPCVATIMQVPIDDNDEDRGSKPKHPAPQPLENA